MRSARHLAETTPESRERVVDLLRAVAIVAVVLGHWLISVVTYNDTGQLTGRSALPDLTWAFPLTWAVQVIPVFFLVGGYANAASLAARWERGGHATDWLLDRSVRLVSPTTVLLVTLAACGGAASLLGAAPDRVRTAVWFATIPLWFLATYLTVVLLTPVTYRLHRRYGSVVLVVLVALVVVSDAARLADLPLLGGANYLFGWLTIHQVGFAWRDGRLRAGPRLGLPLLIGGLAVAVILTGPGPYPVTMINVPGQQPNNMAPVSVALLAVFAAQLGLILLIRRPAERWLRRRGPWTTVVAVNAVILTVFLWHISAPALVAGVLAAFGLLPTPKVGSAAWWLWRIPWLLLLTLMLFALVAIFGRFETRSAGDRDRWRPPFVFRRQVVRSLLTVAGYIAVIVGLLYNSLEPREQPEPLGLPLLALAVYLVGAGTLRLLRTARVATGAAATRDASAGSGS